MKVFAIAFPCAAVAGCMSAATPPSLAPRAIELRGEAAGTAVAPPVAKPLDPALASRISALLADATQGDAEFTNAEAAGRGALNAGRGAPPGSGPWIAAEQARSALDVARQKTATALNEIDTMAVAEAQARADDASRGGLAELQAAQAVIEAMVNRQTARIEDLTRR